MAASERLSVEDGPRGRTGARAVAALAAALALHGALLGGWRWTWRAPPVAAPALQVRSIAVAAPVAVGSPPAAPARSAPAAVAEIQAAAPVAPAESPPATPVPARSPSAPAPVTSPNRPGAPKLADRRAVPADRPAAPAAVAAVSTPLPARVPPEPDDDNAPPPVYRTQLPPSTTLRYDVRRGLADGAAELRWQRDGDDYTLDWQVTVAGVVVLTQSSHGGVDAAGVAPLRFVDQRPSRPAAAANFRRDVGRIGFSRKAPDAVLVPGAQDRLSWLVQLAAIVAAEPGLRQAGAEVRMVVAGAGGDVGDWRFRCQGEDTLATEAGPAVALHFVREPRGPYETRAEAWLDPTGGRFLPLRAAWRSGAADDGFELRLRAAPRAASE